MKFWFVAALVMESRLERGRSRVVHINYVLVSSANVQSAIKAAEKIGKESAFEYFNPEGRAVRVEFLGMRDLIALTERPAHGVEVLYDELLGLKKREALSLVRDQSQFTLFGQPMLENRKGRPNLKVASLIADPKGLGRVDQGREVEEFEIAKPVEKHCSTK